MGILPLLFLIVGLTLKDRLPRFLTALFAVSLLLSFKWSPLFWVLQRLPVFKYFRVPSRWMLIGSFAACLLAGLGADAFLADSHQKFRDKAQAVFKWASVTFLALGAAMTAFVAIWEPIRIVVSAPEEHLSRPAEQPENVARVKRHIITHNSVVLASTEETFIFYHLER